VVFGTFAKMATSSASGTTGLSPFLVPVVMRVYRTYSPCLEEGGA